jgi:hypothetical protein
LLVPKASQVHKVHKDFKVPKVLKVLQVLLVSRAFKVHKVFRVRPMLFLAQRAPKVFKEILVLKDSRAQMAREARRGKLVFLVSRAFKDHKVCKD